MIMHRYFKKPLFKDIWNCITQEKIKKIPQIPPGLMNFCFFFSFGGKLLWNENLHSSYFTG